MAMVLVLGAGFLAPAEGAEEIQMRKVAAYLFGYLGPRKAEFADL